MTRARPADGGERLLPAVSILTVLYLDAATERVYCGRVEGVQNRAFVRSKALNLCFCSPSTSEREAAQVGRFALWTDSRQAVNPTATLTSTGGKSWNGC